MAKNPDVTDALETELSKLIEQSGVAKETLAFLDEKIAAVRKALFLLRPFYADRLTPDDLLAAAREAAEQAEKKTNV